MQDCDASEVPGTKTVLVRRNQACLQTLCAGRKPLHHESAALSLLERGWPQDENPAVG